MIHHCAKVLATLIFLDKLFCCYSVSKQQFQTLLFKPKKVCMSVKNATHYIIDNFVGKIYNEGCQGLPAEASVTATSESPEEL